MISEDTRIINILKVTWINVNNLSLCYMYNKQFLNSLIMKTQSNHQLLKFNSTLNCFMDNSDEKHIMKPFKMVIPLICSSEHNHIALLCCVHEYQG